MTVWELTPIVAVVLIFASMMVVLLIDLARAWQLHREHTRKARNPLTTNEWSNDE